MKYSDFSNQFDREHQLRKRDKQSTVKMKNSSLRHKDDNCKNSDKAGGPVIAVLELPPKKIL
jgi:hypothetical protein